MSAPLTWAELPQACPACGERLHKQIYWGQADYNCGMRLELQTDDKTWQEWSDWANKNSNLFDCASAFPAAVALRAERDRLRAALEEIKQAADNCRHDPANNYGPECGSLFFMADAALAPVPGGVVEGPGGTARQSSRP